MDGGSGRDFLPQKLDVWSRYLFREEIDSSLRLQTITVSLPSPTPQQGPAVIVSVYGYRIRWTEPSVPSSDLRLSRRDGGTQSGTIGPECPDGLRNTGP